VTHVEDRVGSSYLIDHERDGCSLRLVVAKQGDGWQVAVLQPTEHYVAFFDEHALRNWDDWAELAAASTASVTRLA
jgi:hypothetical protein